MIILCNGMMRSGSTLQYNIVKSLLDKSKKKYILLGFYSKYKLKSDFEDLNSKAIERDVYYVLKSHDYSYLNNTDNVYVIYSHRNLLDLAASLKRKFGAKNNDLISIIEKNIDDYCKIIKSNQILIHPYDILISSLSTCVEDINMFLALPTISKKHIDDIAFNNSAKNVIKMQNKNKIQKIFRKFISKIIQSFDMKAKNLFMKFFGLKVTNKIKQLLYQHDKNTLLHLDHISENHGANGNWELILDDNEINEIEKKFKDWIEIFKNE